MRIVLATICCRFRSWGLVKQCSYFCSYFEHKVSSRFWSSGKIWSWSLGSFSLLMFCRGYEIESWSRFGQDFEALWSFLWRYWCLVEVEVNAWSRFWRWNLIKICVWTCDMNSTLGSVVPLAMFSYQCPNSSDRWKSIVYLRFGSWDRRRYPCFACLLLLSACLASAFCLDNIFFLSVFWARLLEGVFFCPFFFTFGLIPSPRPFSLALSLSFCPICIFFAFPSCRLLLLRDLPFFGDFDKRRNLDGFEDFNVSVTDFEDLIME